MPIETLRTEIEELNQEISQHRAEIEALEETISDIESNIVEKEAEIERIEAETAAMDELRQIVNGGEILGRDPAEIRAIIDFIRNGVTPAPDETPSGVVEHTRTVVVNTETGEETEITADMRQSYMTLVGTSHQEGWTQHQYTPELGERVVLSKETRTGNCWGILKASDVNGFEEDIIIGILPTETGSKVAELADVGLPCKTHQDVWQTEDLEREFIVSGAIPAKYITLIPADDEMEPEPEVITAEPELETEEPEPVRLTGEIIGGLASTVAEARRIFASAKPETCTIVDVHDEGSHFKIEYLNHRITENNPFCEASIWKVE